jgi:hypothetical protein
MTLCDDSKASAQGERGLTRSCFNTTGTVVRSTVVRTEYSVRQLTSKLVLNLLRQPCPNFAFVSGPLRVDLLCASPNIDLNPIARPIAHPRTTLPE